MTLERIPLPTTDLRAASRRPEGHVVHYYEHDAGLIDMVAEYVCAGLDLNEPAIVVATPAHQRGLEERLRLRGVDASEEMRRGRLYRLDARDTLARFMVDGWPDRDRFVATVGSVIVRAKADGRYLRVRAFGEMVALLWSQGKAEAALRLEELWTELAREHAFSLLCGYPIDGFRDDCDGVAFERVSDAHERVVPGESYTRASSEAERLRTIARLQQKAIALEAEVHERQRLEAELERKVDLLVEADRRKDEFLAMLAHELRNPLAPLTTALQLMRLHHDDPIRLGRSREVMERQIAHLTRLVDDLLDASRITRGKIALREETVSLGAIVERAVEIARPLIDQRGHRLTLELPTEPVYFVADPVRLEQVVANLLTNAAKFTELGGRIWVRASVEDSVLSLSVADDGAGLSPEMRERVFELFAQAQDAHVRAGGLGVGLALVRRLVEMHGGTIEARSDGPGRGSEFVVRLPLRAPVAGPAPGAVGTTGAAVEPRRILVVDDSADAAEALAELLRDHGHTVRTAHNGASALDEAARMRPEVILLDIAMPEVDGYEVARRLRREAGLASTAIVALTGYDGERLRRRAAEAGFTEVVTKPVDLRTLEGVLRIRA